MRLASLLCLALGAFLSTQQVRAQSDLHTAWGRHLGWGSGAGYHANSQQEIEAWLAARRPPHGSNCTTCGSIHGGDCVPRIDAQPGIGTSSGVQRHHSPQYSQHHDHHAIDQLVPHGVLRRETTVRPRLAPPRQAHPQQQWLPTPQPENVLPAPMANTPSAYHVPAHRPQHHVGQQVAFTTQRPHWHEPRRTAPQFQSPYNLQATMDRQVDSRQVQGPVYASPTMLRQQATWVPPHLTNPLITPTGTAFARP